MSRSNSTVSGPSVGGGGATAGPVSGRSAVREMIAPTAMMASRTPPTMTAAAAGSLTTRSAGSGGAYAVVSSGGAK